MVMEETERRQAHEGTTSGDREAEMSTLANTGHDRLTSDLTEAARLKNEGTER
jgi:hypothetical protein